LWWFLIALVPTAIFPLAEIENDHRMFFPFIGLALAVCWPMALWSYANAPLARATVLSLAAAAIAVLIALAEGTWQRNEVWHSDEALWADVTTKSPRNGRGLMNYGLTQLGKRETKRALDYFERALVYNPDYPALEINLGIATGVLNDDPAAVGHFTRAIQLAPGQTITHFYYGRWLQQKGRTNEAVDQLRQSIALNPDYLDARYLLMEISSKRGEWAEVKALASSTLDRFPSDSKALAYLSHAQSGTMPAPESKTADDYLNLSLSYYRTGQFVESIAAARQALDLRPKYAEAYNNIAAGFASMGQWDDGIAAARQALALKPDFPLARNNLAWCEEQKRKTAQRTMPLEPETASARVIR
jgi:tetratricopeptide (TPR) repeat protein